MSEALILTLGHGSSAILIKNGEIVNGYQNERLSGVKSDSAFPKQAITKLMDYDRILPDCPIYISHWSQDGSVNSMSEKHYDKTYMKTMFPQSNIISTSLDQTHHDAHCHSALAYIGDEIRDNSHVIVADGFGNYGEVLSIYKVEEGRPILIKRAFGYSSSLGLLYQYATDYVGFKMNQDEWKLNALSNLANWTETEKIMHESEKMVKVIYNNLFTYSFGLDDPLMELGALPFTHNQIHEWLKGLYRPDQKAEIALLLQLTIQDVLDYVIRDYDIKNLILVGGVFMNVQLNGHLMKSVDTICVNPLSGDCGAGLGLYRMYNPGFVMPQDLCFGKRDLTIGDYDPDIYYSYDLAGDLINFLEQDMIVNVVTGSMEFGERAYCNTSTIALPTIKNSHYISRVNGRSELMPTCPVMNRATYLETFEDTDKIIKSVDHMIIALKYATTYFSMLGVTHDSIEGLTGRPQVIPEGHWMEPVCEQFPLLINTSFNTHGKPIVNGIKEVISTHKRQQALDFNKRVITLIGV